ncbi:MAG: ABC transporter permease [Lachnospiraceae bacterium]|uniref:ABC transporter permease n=1 Tax=Candidatus Merdisoma sp. JLR.KK006 TaxID=3112626 RepID=UPI002FF0227D|nr:ABC transporter permease [Lachnospiraceae bacterium]
MLKLIYCEFMKLKRKPLFFVSSFLSILIPFGISFLPSYAQTGAQAVEEMMSCLFQLSAYLLLIPAVIVLAANLLFEEQDNDTLKNLMTVPVDKGKLAVAKMLVLLIFSVLFMAVGGLLGGGLVMLKGWRPEGFWFLFFVGLGEALIMWVGTMPCVLLVVAYNKSYIVSVIITFFYTMVNYILSTSTPLLTQSFGLNPGTLLPGPLALRWFFQFYDHSNPSEELAALLEQISPYFLSNVQAFGVAAMEGAVFLTLIAFVYKRQETQ